MLEEEAASRLGMACTPELSRLVAKAWPQAVAPARTSHATLFCCHLLVQGTLEHWQVECMPLQAHLDAAGIDGKDVVFLKVRLADLDCRP